MRRRKQTPAPVLIHYPGRRLRRMRPNALRRFWRIPMLLLYLLLAYPLALWTCARKAQPDESSYRAFAWWSRRALRVLGIRLRVDGKIPVQPVMIAANHVSYLDILALATLIPGRFVAKKEMRDWPFFGIMGVWLGTLFIDRSDARASQRIMRQASDIIMAGTSVVLFPEGTTSDGKSVGEFYAAPFETAAAAKAETVPVALRYEDVLQPGQPDGLCPFVGDDSLFGHLWRLAAAAPLTLRVEFLPALPSELGRRQLAQQTRMAISEALQRMEQGASITYLQPRRGRHPLRDAWAAWRRSHGG
ncbi:MULTISPECIES: lysophospholipid acyltransferase family protein [Acidithiobacillus]|uniref:lysophospholipid acyltransferase family protein n=1 Tax=Acidithiobacillus TaxID=119977 RepID=UPI00187A6182|nr:MULTISPECIES: lysophospholipid acyltransferase family protein [Acidithiobacillus]MBE7566761.1 1-acyl-sn-glycerol-3-phosphate acyltransferase [Acidithiobacillus sp. HP-11]